MLRLEVTPGRLAGHRRIRAIRRPIPASAGSSPCGRETAGPDPSWGWRGLTPTSFPTRRG